ncbi:hypothetical protein VNO80_15985 [Phaseolus coccineus]|uniref:Uncharacterized protein n=1 Tax=Phaseolus coccineus TaxID=3886 RepID=A0AAN9MLB0_PHACN
MSDEQRRNIPAIAGHMTRANPVESTRRVLHVATVLWMSALGKTIRGSLSLFQGTVLAPRFLSLPSSSVSIFVWFWFYCFGLGNFHFNHDAIFIASMTME